MPSLLAIVVLLLSGCNLGGGAALPDSGGDARPAESGAEESGPRADGGDAEGEPRPGPMTFVVRRIVALDERLCDLDGDGSEDNAIADLGSPDAGLVATALTSVLDSSINSGSRWIMHLPHVDDIVGPDASNAVLVAGEALDEEMCEDAESCTYRTPDSRATWDDDFSGEEGFWLRSEELDDCGEPLSVTRDVSIVDGEVLEVDAGLAVAIPLARSRLWGEIAAGGVSAEIEVCGAALARVLGGLAERAAPGGLSYLELLTAGGAIIGAAELSGLEPNLDLDGDGLERLEVDDDGRLSRCVDGDQTVVEGPDCWQDARIADGFALSLRFELVSARFLGRDPFWEQRSCGSVVDATDRSCGDPEVGHRATYQRLCPGNAGVLGDLLGCAEESCPETCDDCPDMGCRACRNAACVDEWAACQAAICCADPPAGSVLDAP